MSENSATQKTRRHKGAGDWVAMAWAVLALVVSLVILVLGAYSFLGSGGSAGAQAVGARLVGVILAWVVGAVILIRYARVLIGVLLRDDFERARQVFKFDLIQFFLIVVLLVVMFPLLWIFSMSLTLLRIGLKPTSF